MLAFDDLRMLGLIFLKQITSTKEKVDKPPIEIKDISVKSKTPVYKTYNKTDKIYIDMFVHGDMTLDEAKIMAKKAILTKNFKTKYNKIEFDINTNVPEKRMVRKTVSAIRLTKLTNGSRRISIKSVEAKANVISKVVTTKTDYFLIFPISKDVSIKWRPLETFEIEQVNEALDKRLKIYEDFINC